MGKKKTTSEIVNQFKLVHGNVYDYSLVDYINDSTKVVIVCKSHGPFKQSPAGHFRCKHGCPKCGRIKKAGCYRKTHGDIINEIEKIYGYNAFDFSKLEYKNAHTKILLRCIKHDTWFETHVGSLLKHKYGCFHCEMEKRHINQNKKWLCKFIDDSRLVHGNKYDYSKVYYINGNTPVTIICDIHGEFQQLPVVHRLAKSGCPICKYSKGEHKIMQYLNQKNIEYVPQYRVNISDSYHYFDFYLPKFNLIIEFNGKQHYEPTKWCSSMNKKQILDQFEYIRRRDSIKSEYCISNNIDLLTISYLDFDNIFIILNKTLNV